MTIRAVTFDFWSTLVTEDPTVWDIRVAAWRAILHEHSYARPDDEILAAFTKAWHAYLGAWHANEVFDASSALDVMVAVLGLEADRALTAALLEVLTDPPSDRYPTLNANVLACLDALKARGTKLGIICDVGLTPSRVLRRYLDQQGALEYFDHWSFSDEVGVFKPDAKIFHHALHGLGGVAPEHAAHVGDLRRTDIAGGRSMGMVTIRYRGVNDDPPADDGPIIEGDHVVDDHGDIPDLLGII